MRLLKSQTRSLLQKIDMDSKMKKMAELQLSVVGDPKNRKAIENQVPPTVCHSRAPMHAPMCVRLLSSQVFPLLCIAHINIY